MSEKINLHQALDIFEENIPETEKAAQDNMNWNLSQLIYPKPNVSADLFWVKANLYLLGKEAIVNQFKPVLRAISLRKQPKSKDSITQSTENGTLSPSH
jgi:hypothetical protein